MKPSSFQYALRDAFRSMWRNKFMGLASIATVAISLLVLGFAWLLVINSQFLADKIESELEVNVYLIQGLQEEQVTAIKEELESLGGIAEITYVSKDEGLKNLEEKFGQETDILKALGGVNPLPDMFRIKVSEAAQVPAFAGAAANLEGIENVRYGQGMVERLLTLTNWLRTAGLVVIIAVGTAAVFLIATTIRLTVFARRREISIMKFVGATNWYIRWPFFLEGMMIGLIGAIISVSGLHLFYSQLVSNITLTVSFLPVMTDKGILLEIYKNLLLMGTTLGALGSAISLHRFLKV